MSGIFVIFVMLSVLFILSSLISAGEKARREGAGERIDATAAAAWTQVRVAVAVAFKGQHIGGGRQKVVQFSTTFAQLWEVHPFPVFATVAFLRLAQTVGAHGREVDAVFERGFDEIDQRKVLVVLVSSSHENALSPSNVAKIVLLWSTCTLIDAGSRQPLGGTGGHVS